jgi:hypothetical protein
MSHKILGDFYFAAAFSDLLYSGKISTCRLWGIPHVIERVTLFDNIGFLRVSSYVTLEIAQYCL